MKKTIVLIAIVSLIAVMMTSCSATRRSGCPDTWGKVGYN